jgi:hypothetical protein
MLGMLSWFGQIFFSLSSATVAFENELSLTAFENELTLTTIGRC